MKYIDLREKGQKIEDCCDAYAEARKKCAEAHILLSDMIIKYLPQLRKRRANSGKDTLPLELRSYLLENNLIEEAAKAKEYHDEYLLQEALYKGYEHKARGAEQNVNIEKFLGRVEWF